MSTLVVTGASGFIGQYLTAAARTQGHSIIAVGRNRPQISGVTNLSWTELKNASIPGPAAFVHLAGPSVINEFDKLSPAALDELIGAADLLVSLKFASGVFCSSAAVYPANLNRALVETDSPDPQSAYARFKLQLEQKFLSSGYAVARLGNVYGRGLSEVSVLSLLGRQFLGPDALIKVRCSLDVRDYIYVDDVVSALMALAVDPNAEGIYNVGSGIGTSVEGLYQVIKEILRSEKQLSADNLGTPTSLVLDSKKLQTRCNWQAKVDLMSGLLKTFASNNL